MSSQRIILAHVLQSVMCAILNKQIIYAGIVQTNDVAIVTNMSALNIRLTVQAVVIKFASGVMFANIVNIFTI